MCDIDSVEHDSDVNDDSERHSAFDHDFASAQTQRASRRRRYA
jgi:hypothetical protein